jgi:hypothetical protein
VALAAISESTEPEPVQEYTQDSTYTLDPPQPPIDNLTTEFSRANLSEATQAEEPSPASQSNINVNQARGRSNSFNAGESILLHRLLVEHV